MEGIVEAAILLETLYDQLLFILYNVYLEMGKGQVSNGVPSLHFLAVSYIVSKMVPFKINSRSSIGCDLCIT